MRTDTHYEANSRFWQFCGRALKPLQLNNWKVKVAKVEEI
jgi:hypothetical protein